ncbi:aminotransferase class I/II-fold pyridoxal phosphate-dependent enzyme [Nocardia sp. CA-290969]|uniref:aminotransferase class I/II-fold pyridoxal phosphate-dependent enzyme n=1 Tax=Nocardia sp. CA-290969 TaxID=3239986 RepID=UPI003D9430E3
MTTGRRADFTSALFLGLLHPSASLPDWASLTTGVPAAVDESAVAERIGTAMAAAQRADAGLVSRSSLHALLDVFTLLPRPGTTVVVDEAAYPTLQLAAEAARRTGARVCTYRHHCPESIERPAGWLIVASDGWCPGCNRPAPIAALRDLAVGSGGLLVLDDSLACGVLGRTVPGEIFGDGTGTPRRFGVNHRDLVWVASFAKAYGTPLAVVTGPEPVLARWRSDGSRLHAAPPSVPDLAAAQRALRLSGPLRRRRMRLQTRVMAARRMLTAAGLPCNGLPFPMVGVPLPVTTAVRWWEMLRVNGIDALVQRPRCRREALLSFALGARHSAAEIHRLGTVLRAVADEGAA